MEIRVTRTRTSDTNHHLARPGLGIIDLNEDRVRVPLE
jgi:hypothetical protein